MAKAAVDASMRGWHSALLALVFSIAHVDAHLTAVCSSVSRSIPDRVVFWFATYGHNQVEPPMKGGLVLRDPAGIERLYDFSALCDTFNADLKGTNAGTADYQSVFQHYCTGTTYLGKKVIDINSEFTCYHPNPTPLTDGENWAIGMSDETSASFFGGGWDGDSEYVDRVFPVPVDNVIAGHYRLETKKTDDRLDPCYYQWGGGDGIPPYRGEGRVCYLGTNSLSRRRHAPGVETREQWWFEVGEPGGRADCVAPPSGPFLSDTDFGPRQQSFCANKPDGFICPVSCNPGKRQVGQLACIDGAWSTTFACVSNYCTVPDVTTTNLLGAWDGANGYPSGIRPSRTSPSCGVNSEAGAICSFTCSGGENSWGYGRLVCDNNGTWQREFADAECKGPSEDSKWPKLNGTLFKNLGFGNMQINFAVNYDGVARSEIYRFEVRIVPGGRLTCPDLYASTPPERGILCYGGDPNSMHKYEARVRAWNKKAPSQWSDKMVAICDPLLPAPEHQHRWTVSACDEVYPGDSCNVTCVPGMTPDGSPSSTYTCPMDTTITALQGSYPRCYKPARAPVQVRVVGRSDSSVAIEWTDAGRNDVDNINLPFAGWTVEVMPEAGGTWQVPAGCTGLAGECDTSCTATGLLSNTLYLARVIATCGNPIFSSPASRIGPGGTLPQMAGPPSGLEVVASDSSSLSIVWQPSTQQGDCIFSQWMVVLQWSNGAVAGGPPGCQNLDLYEESACVLTDLPCDDTVEIAVMQFCENDQAGSAFSERIIGTTTRDGNCLVPATPPTPTLAARSGLGRLFFRWNAGQSNDCQFQKWTVYLQRTFNGQTGSWFESPDCSSLTTRTRPFCYPSGLDRGFYRFTVEETCVELRTSSPPSLPSGAAEVPPTAARRPSDVRMTAPARDGFKISWRAEDLQHCIFERWQVDVMKVSPGGEGGDPDRRLEIVVEAQEQRYWRDPAGCDSLVSACTTECTVTGLPSNTDYRVNVKAICEDYRTSSQQGFPGEGDTIRTLPTPAAAPINVSAAASGDHSADISWVPADASPDCQFLSWDVQVQEVGFATWNDPLGCDGFIDENSVSCTARGLRCNTTHRARVREVCANDAASGNWTVSGRFTTEVGIVCLKAASPPEYFRLRARSATAMEVSFSPGSPGHCKFMSYQVQRRKVGEAEWVVAGGCSRVLPRGGPLCVAEELDEDTAYEFRAREICETDELSSTWGVSETPAYTQRVPPLVSRGQIPANDLTEKRPTSLTLILGSNAYLDSRAISQGASLTICPSTDEPEPNSCGCTGGNCTDLCFVAETDRESRSPRVYMASPQVLWYSFSSVFQPVSFCNYEVTVGRGFLKTEAQPAKSSPTFKWSFRYTPTPPRLGLTLLRSTPTSLDLAVTWSEPVSFTCSVVSEPTINATGVYTGPDPVKFSLAGLEPAMGYAVLCDGTPVNDPWNPAQETHGPMLTEPDTNSKLSDLQVTYRMMCNDSHSHSVAVSNVLVPALNTSQVGGTYAASLDASHVRAMCNIPFNQSAVAMYEVTLEATPQSPRATLAYPSGQSSRLSVDLPSNGPPVGGASIQMEVSVHPFSRPAFEDDQLDAPQRATIYTVQAGLIFANIVAVQMRTNSNPLLLNGSTSMELDLTMATAVNADYIQVRIDNVLQTTQAIPSSISTLTVGGQTEMNVTVRVPGATGLGRDLPVAVLLSGIEYTTAYTVSFEDPPVLDRNGMPACPTPDPSNNAGISGPGGYPMFVYLTPVRPACQSPTEGYSDSGADCLFGCTRGWGLGTIVCDRGTWRRGSESTDCRPHYQDALWSAPTITELSDEGGGAMKVFFRRPTQDNTPRSAIFFYMFNVVPAGELVCQRFVGETPPANGVWCVEGDPNNMGKYEIRVAAVNVKGLGEWSAPAQRMCQPLAPPVSEAWRYNISECASLLDRASCRPRCGSGLVQVGAPQDFVCNNPPAAPVGTYPMCLKPAETPVGVTVQGENQTSALVLWEDAGLNDCGTLVQFVRWRVQVRAAGGAWEEPTGCSNLFSPCTSVCTATGLTSNTVYEVKVSALCGAAEANSLESQPGSGTTLPLRARAPVNMRVVGTETTAMSVAWEPSPQQRDCIFEKYMVQVRSPSGTWNTNPDGCQDPTGPSCTILGLQCDSTYTVQVRTICTDKLANSALSSAVTASTIRDGACLMPAGTPTGLAFSTLRWTSVHLSWTPGAPNDCLFQSYKVRVQRTDRFGTLNDWEEVEGCRSLPSRSYAQCTATGLSRGTYSFWVQEQCQDSRTSSAISSASAGVTLPLRPAFAPTGVTLDSPGRSSYRVVWSAPELNDCTFQRWFVEVKPEGGSWQAEPEGCRDLINPCVSHCEVTSTDSYTKYQARVSVKCSETTAESPASTESNELTTLPVVSGAPPSVAASNLTVTTAEIDWTSGARSSDCYFLEWEVQMQVETYPDWRTPEGCGVASRTTTRCTARNLLCGTTYRARVRELCSPPGASSPFTTSVAFSTLRSTSCMVGSDGPLAVRMGSATTTSLQISFSPGNGNDCTFAGFDVQQQIEGEGSWDPAGGSCASITRRDDSSCTATGLLDGTAYRFRVRERCSNGAALDSPWVISEDHAETVAVPPVTLMARRPEGDLSVMRPGTVTVILKDGTRMVTPTTKRLRICPSTSLPLPNPCGCTGQGCSAGCVVPPLVPTSGVPHVQLLSPEVLYYDFSSVLQVGSGCEYYVELDDGLLQTALTPSKESPSFRWTFKYTPPPPQLLQVSVVRSTTTSITLSIAWSEPTRFTCSAPGTSSVSSAVEYTGVSAVEVTLTGLLPSSSYDVEFEGSALSDPWNRAREVRGVYRTEDDTDSRLSQLQVFVRRQCCSSCAPGPAAPALLRPEFDPARSGAVQHAIHIDYSNFRDECTINASALAQPRYLVSVNATPRSGFASVAFDPISREQELTVDWPAGVIPTGSAVKSLEVQVNPYTGGSTQASTFTVEANLLTTSINGQSLTQSQPGPLPADGSVSIELNITTLVGVNTANFGISLGPFVQQVQLVSTTNALVNGLQQTFSILKVQTPSGVGTNLPVIVNAGALEYQLPLSVSFAAPTVTGLYTMVNGLSAEASLLQDSAVRIQGTGLAPLGTSNPAGSSSGNSSGAGLADTASQIYIVGLPGGCTDAVCQHTTVQQLWNAGTSNLCGRTVALSANELECMLRPSTQNPLGTAVMTRDGATGLWIASVVVNAAAMTYEAPVMSGMTVRQQDLASAQPFSLNGRSFPEEELTQGYMQVWASPNTDAIALGSANATTTLSVDSSNADNNLQPLCSYARRISATEIQCQTTGNWQGRALSTNPVVFVQVGPRKLSADVLRGALLIPQMVVTSVNSTDPSEVGPKEIQINGANFGEQANGPLEVILHSMGSATVAVEDSRRRLGSLNMSQTAKVPCVVNSRTSTVVRCVMNNTIFGTPLRASEYDYGVGADALSSLKNYPVMVEVRFAGANPAAMEAAALQDTHDFTVQLLTCSSGHHRTSHIGKGCRECQPGKYKNETSAALSCRPCPPGAFGAYPGLGTCQQCDTGYTTWASGASYSYNCTCAPGFFKNLTDPSRGPHGSGICLPCPAGAHCDGRETQPYAQSGYWTPDRLRFWDCYPASACMTGSADTPNVCESTRRSDSRRCVQCESGHYRFQSECHVCGEFDKVIAWLGPILLLLLLWLVILPCTTIHFRQHIHKDPEARKIKDGGLMGNFVDVDAIFGGERPKILKKLTHPDHPTTRMITLAFNRMQLLWALGLIPYAWPHVLETQHTILGFFAFDIDILRPACMTVGGDFIDPGYFATWVISWIAPYFYMFNITLGLFIMHRRHQDPHDKKWINFPGATVYVLSVIYLFALMRHVVDNVQFAHCMPCEDNDSCLIDYPLIKCGFADNDEEWMTMAIMSILDFVLVAAPVGAAMLYSIYLSWNWQHGHGVGVDKHGRRPWYVWMSEFWVKDYRGYSAQFRRVAMDLRTLIREKAHGDADLRDVWMHCRFLVEEEEWKFHESLLKHVLHKLLRLSDLESKAALKKISKRAAAGSGAANPAELGSERSGGSGPGMVAMISNRSEGSNIGEITTSAEERRVMRTKEKWVRRLLYLIERTEEFVKKTGSNIRILTRGSLFFTYAWEYFWAVQKVVIVCVILLTAHTDGSAIKAACLLFMLLLLVCSVDLRPYSWSFLNNLDLLMDILTLYMVIFMQLDWPTWLTFSSITVNIVTVLPVLLRLILPPFHGELHEEEREVIQAASSTIEQEMKAEESAAVDDLLAAEAAAAEDGQPAEAAAAGSEGGPGPAGGTPQASPSAGDQGAGAAPADRAKPNLALAALNRLTDNAPAAKQPGVPPANEVHVDV